MKFLILAGGVGSRLWPLSTKNKPKQFQNFIDEKTLLQQAYDRLSFADPQDIFVATNQEYIPYIQEQLPMLQEHQIISEPLTRDTAPSIAFAMKYLESLFGDSETVSIIYADQVIKDKVEFKDKLLYGHNLAKQSGNFVIIEVKAKYPNPNLGYVKVGHLISQEKDIEVYELDHFTEKPDLKTAKKFVESFKYLWNTGFYIWQIKSFFNQLKLHAPDITSLLNQITDFNDTHQIYSQFPKISLDYALIEKMDPKNVMIIPAELGWSDVGTWQTLYDELTIEDNDNLTEGKVFHLDTTNSLLINKNPQQKVAIVNVDNLVVINTPEQVLVCNKSDDQKIKEILKKYNLE